MNHELSPKTTQLNSPELDQLNEAVGGYYTEVEDTAQELTSRKTTRRADALKDAYNQHDAAMDTLHEVKAIPGFRRSAVDKAKEWTASRDIVASRETIDNYADQETPEDVELKEDIAHAQELWSELGGPELEAARDTVDSLNFKSNATDRVKAKGDLRKAEVTLYNNMAEKFNEADEEPVTPVPASEPVSEPVPSNNEPTTESIAVMTPQEDKGNTEPLTVATSPVVNDSEQVPAPLTSMPLPRNPGDKLDENVIILPNGKTRRRDYTNLNPFTTSDVQQIRRILAAENYNFDKEARRPRISRGVETVTDAERAAALQSARELAASLDDREPLAASRQDTDTSKTLGRNALRGLRSPEQRRRATAAKRAERMQRLASFAHDRYDRLQRRYENRNEALDRVKTVRVGSIISNLYTQYLRDESRAKRKALLKFQNSQELK